MIFQKAIVFFTKTKDFKNLPSILEFFKIATKIEIKKKIIMIIIIKDLKMIRFIGYFSWPNSRPIIKIYKYFLLFSSLDLPFLQYMHYAQWIQEITIKSISKFNLFLNIRHNSIYFWDHSLLIYGFKAISFKISRRISFRNNCSIWIQHLSKREKQKSNLAIHSYI